MERHELRFATRAALARAFGELARSPFVEGCQADVERRLLRFITHPASPHRRPTGALTHPSPPGKRRRARAASAAKRRAQ
jgi:hypothetical protein